MQSFHGIALCQNSGAQIRNLGSVPCYTFAIVSRETFNYFNSLFHVKHSVNASVNISNVSRETSVSRASNVSRETSVSLETSHYFNSLFHVKHSERFVSRETSKKVKV